MNMTDLFRESAIFMAKDRPDIYTAQSAMEDLIRIHDDMAQYEDSGWSSFASYILFKNVEDGVTEWYLTRKLSSAILFPEENEARVYSHTHHGGGAVSALDLPDVLDDSQDF